ncbi:MAG: hypothetical protein ACI9C4_002303, partial [Paraglaciecola sp.]
HVDFIDGISAISIFIDWSIGQHRYTFLRHRGFSVLHKHSYTDYSVIKTLKQGEKNDT